MKLPVSWLKQYVDVTLPADKLAERLTLSGTKVETVAPHGSDTVIHIEVTTNRPDCLSITGLAREVAALTGKKLKPVKTGPVAVKGGPIRVRIEDKKGCARYTARVLRNVTIRPAPVQVLGWLDAVGTRAINNVVDATNFVLFETGQPLHAFDLDKLAGGQIVVRRARQGEKFQAIDGNTYELDAQTLVIADLEKPVAIAGVMGGKATEVTGATRNILLEGAYFDPATVRRASKKYKLTTESSYRFERGVDPGGIVAASARARDLILKWGGGKETGAFTDTGPARRAAGAGITASVSGIQRSIGLELSGKRMAAILKSLEVKTVCSKDRLTAAAPSFRRDLKIEADLAEEILRIEGFDKVPAAIPVTHHAQTAAAGSKAREVLELKKHLASLGLTEIITFSLISEKMVRDSGIEPSLAARIANPLSAAQQCLRPSLLPGMLEALLYNIHRKADSLKLFEIGNRYIDNVERTVLAVALCGEFGDNWLRKGQATYFDLKGIVESVLAFLRLNNAVWEAPQPQTPYAYRSTASHDAKALAQAGQLASPVLARWDIPKDVFFAEILLDEALLESRSIPAARVRPLPKFPVVGRDIAFIVDDAVPVDAIAGAITKAGQPHVASVRLFDEFKGKNIGAGRRSLAFSVSYQKDSGTFTDAEILALQERVAGTLKAEFNAEIRA